MDNAAKENELLVQAFLAKDLGLDDAIREVYGLENPLVSQESTFKENKISVSIDPKGQKLLGDLESLQSTQNARPRAFALESMMDIAGGVALTGIALSHIKNILVSVNETLGAVNGIKKEGKELGGTFKATVKFIRNLFNRTSEDKRIKQLEKDIKKAEEKQSKLDKIKELEDKLAKLQGQQETADMQAVKQDAIATMGLDDTTDHTVDTLIAALQKTGPEEKKELVSLLSVVVGGLGTALDDNTAPATALKPELK